MPATERIMIDEAFENNTYRVLSTPIKKEIPTKDWQTVSTDDFSWWDIKKEKEQIFSERKLRNQLKLSSDAAILEGMVFIKVSESRKVKDVIPYTKQARSASKEVYDKVLKA